MTATSGRQVPVGLRRIQVFELNDNGTPNGLDPVVPYTGFQLRGAKTYGFSPQEPRQFSHVGEDQVVQTDLLPALQAGTAEVAVSALDYTAISLMSGIKVFEVGEASAILLASDRQGFEPLVGMMIYQQSKDLETGARRWRTAILQSVRGIFLPPGMGENPIDARYRLSPSVSGIHLWGADLSESVEGGLTSQGVELMCEGIPQIGSFLGNGSQTIFDFPSTTPALTTAKVKVWVDGVATVPTTLTTTGFTISPAPTSGKRIVYFLESVRAPGDSVPGGGS